MLLCDVEALDVEAEPRDGRAREAEGGRSGSEALEAGLGVENAGQQERLDNLVEGAAHQVPRVQVVEEARAHQVARVGQHAAGDGDVRSQLELAHDLVHFVERVGEVHIGEDAVLAAGSHHATGNGVSLAAVGRVAEEAGKDAAARVVLENELRLDFAGMIVHEDHFHGARIELGERVNGREGSREQVRRVVDGDDQRKRRRVRGGVEHEHLINGCRRVASDIQQLSRIARTGEDRSRRRHGVGGGAACLPDDDPVPSVTARSARCGGSGVSYIPANPRNVTLPAVGMPMQGVLV